MKECFLGSVLYAGTTKTNRQSKTHHCAKIGEVLVNAFFGILTSYEEGIQ